MIKRVNIGVSFKERSASCGLTAVPLHGSGGPEMYTAGLFATEIARCFPMMPLEEAERLNNRHIRNSFIERIFQYRRLKDA